MICSARKGARRRLGTLMPTADYQFVDRWRVEADVKEVAGIIEDALSLPRWWGSVYFDVEELEPGEGTASAS